MVRFDKLKEATRDQIVAFIAQIAATFNVPEEELASIIPEDIRVRTDDGRKQPENDARNWGIVFLTLLTSITVRHVDGNLAMFQRDLRAVIADNNDDDQPWCTLDNLRQLKSLYEADNMRSSATPQEGEEEDLFAEQVGEEVQTGSKRSLGEGASLSQKGKRTKRLRRSSVGWARPEKGKPTKKPSSKVTPSPSPSRVSSSSSGSEEEDPSQQTEGPANTEIEQLEMEIAVADADVKVARLRRNLFYKRARARYPGYGTDNLLAGTGAFGRSEDRHEE